VWVITATFPNKSPINPEKESFSEASNLDSSKATFSFKNLAPPGHDQHSSTTEGIYEAYVN
jgi:hypothetical protein